MQNVMEGKESYLTERQRERVCVCVRGRVYEKGGSSCRYKDNQIYINIKRKCKAIRRTNYADKDIAATIAMAHLFFS